MRVYISGAITGTNDYYWRFAEAEKYLTSKGYKVVNPAAVVHAMPEMEYEEIMDFCFQLMDMCGAIYMMEGWQQSLGANREYGYACGKDMLILKYTDEVEQWTKQK